MPIMRGEYAELIGKALAALTWQRLRERPEQYRRYVDVQNTNEPYIDTFEMAGFGPLAKKTEMGDFILDEPIKLGGVRFIPEAFGLGFAISREMKDDSRFNLMSMLARDLGRSARITAELYGHDVLNNGFTNAKYAGRDGLALFSTAHPLVGTGGTQSNTQTVATDLSEAALEAAIGLFDEMVDDRGVPVEMSARWLVISAQNRMLAKRLLNSAGFPGTDLNDVNPLADEGLGVAVTHWLTDKDAWFLFPDASESPIKFYWRTPPDTNTWDDNNTGATFHTIYQRHATGFDTYHGVFGSPGA